MAGKVVRDKKLEEYENENYYSVLWWSEKRHFPYNCLGLSDEDNSVSQTNNFVNVNVFNSVTSPRVPSNHCVFHYFSTMPVGFNFNLTFGLKPQVGSIKIVTVYKRSIFESWGAHSHFDYQEKRNFIFAKESNLIFWKEKWDDLEIINQYVKGHLFFSSLEQLLLKIVIAL